MLINQLGHMSTEANVWVTTYYLRGLDKTVRDGILPHLEDKDTLDDLIKKVSNVARNVDFGKGLERSFRSSSPHSSNAPPSRPYNSGPSLGPTESTSAKSRTFTKI